MALTQADIQLICGRYEEDRAIYERLSSEIHTVLAKVVETCGVRYMITHRAKGSSSLYRKLWKDREKYSPADFVSALSPPMKDLAAARVLLYLPDDIDPVVDALKTYFDEQHHHLTVTNRRSDRYDAMHLHVKCDGMAFSVEGLQSATVFEVQICTLSAHIWNELEHDIIYKQPSGLPDAAQEELLVALRGILDLGSRTANRLMLHTNELISRNKAPILDAGGLQFELRTRSNGRALKGDFQALFDLLSGLMDPLHNVALHACFETGRSESQARELMKEYDVDGAHADAGCIMVQLLPNFTLSAIEQFVGSHDNPPALFKFVRRVAAAIHTEEKKS